MSNFDHWMRFNIGDYLADTMHLSTYQHGIYVMLIMHYFKRGELPNDEAALRRIAKVNSVLLWRNESPAVMALWKRENGVLRHTRIDAARAEAQRISEKRAKAGQRGGTSRWHAENQGPRDPILKRAAAYVPDDDNPLETNGADMANAIDGNGKCYDTLVRARATPQLQPDPPLNPPLAKSRRRKKDSAWTDLAKRGVH